MEKKCCKICSKWTHTEADICMACQKIGSIREDLVRSMANLYLYISKQEKTIDKGYMQMYFTEVLVSLELTEEEKSLFDYICNDRGV